MIPFSFEGRALVARPGQSLAAALTEAGIRDLRDTPWGARRGVFCGMGVCQDCLVEVDGLPNRRACMTDPAPGMAVRRQAALPALAEAALPPRLPARADSPDVLVVGGGAGGLSAGIAAARAGARVLLLDERHVPGGQYYKQARGAPPLDAQQRAGAALLAEAGRAGVEILAGAEVWGAFEGLLFHAEQSGPDGDRALILTPKAAVIATGAHERPRMVPGWDLPGVMTTGAAQTLWRSARTLPGARVAVAGSGPLNAQVALELARGGAQVALLAEAAPAPWTRPGRVAAMALADPALVLKGAGMVAGLARRGVRLRFETVLTAVEPSPGGLVVHARGPGAPVLVEVDAVCMNDGFQPQNEILRLLGAAMRYDATFDQLRPVRDGGLQTSVPGLYAVGDCCGLGGAPAAREEGAIAGAAAAGAPVPWAAGPRRRLARHRRFQAALWALHRPGLRPLEEIGADVPVCRCENVSRAALDAAMDAGSTDIGAVKRATRAGMGRCQGRYCAPVLARRMAGPGLGDHGFFAPRVPVRPVSVVAILAAREGAGDSGDGESG